MAAGTGSARIASCLCLARPSATVVEAVVWPAVWWRWMDASERELASFARDCCSCGSVTLRSGLECFVLFCFFVLCLQMCVLSISKAVWFKQYTRKHFDGLMVAISLRIQDRFLILFYSLKLNFLFVNHHPRLRNILTDTVAFVINWWPAASFSKWRESFQLPEIPFLMKTFELSTWTFSHKIITILRTL